MLNVPLNPRKIVDYESIVKEGLIDSINQKAKAFKGKTVLHLSSTSQGGGVAEMLHSQAPLLADVGLKVKWQIIEGDYDFFTITKNLHNGLQGADFLWTDFMVQEFKKHNEANARNLDVDADFVIVHDPQPVALLHYFLEQKKQKKGHWIWRCHIDLTDARADMLEFMRPFVELYDATIFTLLDYCKPELGAKKPFQIYPTIDPLSAKNMFLTDELVLDVLNRYGIDASKPILTQVGRYDPWKDPLGVIDVYRLAKKKFSDLQLVMVSSMASDDPEGWHYFEKTARYAGLDNDIILLSNFNGVGNVEVNAIQRASDVILLKSIREGFGLVVSEGMWKEKPVVGNNVGGIPVQIEDNKTGFLVASTEEAAQKVTFLLNEKQRAGEMGKLAREVVRENFLSPVAINKYLEVFEDLAG